GCGAGPVPDGVVAGVPHHPRVLRRRVRGRHHDRGVDRHQARRCRGAAAGTPLGEGHGGPSGGWGGGGGRGGGVCGRGVLRARGSKVMAVRVAVGAVSGTVLSYEMGLLWPGLMGRFGAAIGFPFSVEGIFFFLEAIFVGVYLYGWKRLSPWAHWWSGMPIVVA